MKRPEQIPTSQTQLGLVSVPPALRIGSQQRLRAGDIIRLGNRICPVLRVTESAAVIALAQPAREFTTIFGKCVHIKPKPRLVRISANSEVPILRRRSKGGRL